MGIITVSDEFTSVIPRERIFKSLIFDADNLVPKLLPQIIKSIDIAEGDGGAGTIKQMNFAEEGVSKITKKARSISLKKTKAWFRNHAFPLV
nr:major allergen Pru ar 1-like [Coffea arabica]